MTCDAVMQVLSDPEALGFVYQLFVDQGHLISTQQRWKICPVTSEDSIVSNVHMSGMIRGGADHEK